MTDESDVAEFRKAVLENVRADASAEGIYTREALLREVGRRLIAADELPDLTPCLFRGKGTKKRELVIDGFCLDEAELDNSVSLVVVASKDSDPNVPSLGQLELDSMVDRAMHFVQDSVDGKLHETLEPSQPAHDLSSWLYEHRSKLNCIRIYAATDAALGARTKLRDDRSVSKIRVELHVWDIVRFMRADIGGGREPIEIDLKEFSTNGISALPASVGDTAYKTYLCVVGGETLASLYDRYGARLLEGNVRSFLSVRGGVNKGMQNTILTEPARFFAYNNGITATAADVTLTETTDGRRLTWVKDLQIVNGGQTTASMFYASKRNAENLKQVYVQMKLSVVPKESADELVAKIARYANTQNRISDADLFSNHPFHRRIADISSRVWADPAPGMQNQTRWYYERARGQYQNEQARAPTAAKKKAFLLLNPKNQLITKTDLAKFENAWLGYPHIVSKGAQKNFVAFAEAVTDDWEKDPAKFNDRWFQHLVAKAIIFRASESLVDEQSWYDGGYRANIVAFGIARLAHELRRWKREADFDRIWKSQALSKAFERHLLLALKLARDAVYAPPPGMSNLSEWAKKADCWEKLKGLKLDLGADLLDELQSREAANEDLVDARRDRKMTDGIEAQKLVITLGPAYWAKVLAWNRQTKQLQPKESAIATLAAAKSGKFVPSELQALVLVRMNERIRAEGFVG